ASPAVKISNPRLSPRGAYAPSVAVEPGVRIPAAGPARVRLYSHSGGLGAGSSNVVEPLPAHRGVTPVGAGRPRRELVRLGSTQSTRRALGFRTLVPRSEE